MRRLRPTIIATVAAVATSLAVGVPAASATSSPDQQRQQAFTAASAEFGVPESVLLGVSYLESRWDANTGTPSVSAGFGPMHLTDVTAAPPGTEHDSGTDPRGDDARPVLHPVAAPGALDSASLHTVDLAAQLINVDAATLRADPVQNIRGGA